jgi:hypothetical protein
LQYESSFTLLGGKNPNSRIEAQMTDSENDPKIITSRHCGSVTRDGVTVELRILRLETTKWTLEVVDAVGTSTVWDDEFETDDAAYAEFQKTIAHGMLEFQPALSRRVN